jgi:hypothetical protein
MVHPPTPAVNPGLMTSVGAVMQGTGEDVEVDEGQVITGHSRVVSFSYMTEHVRRMESGME